MHTAMNNLRVYIASPLFTPSQKATLDEVESMLDSANITYFSPRRGGGNLAGKEGTERANEAQFIFDENVEMLTACNVLIANIDDRDVGTAFEIGRFSSKPSDANIMITFSGNGYGLNIMLNNCGTEGHFESVEALRTLFPAGKYIPNLSELRRYIRSNPNNILLAKSDTVEKD